MIKNLFKSFAFAVLMVLFPVCASVIIQINNITSDTMGYAIQAAFFALASVIGLVIYKKHQSKSKKSHFTMKKELLWFFPIIISELFAFSVGFQFRQDFLLYFCLILFTVFVGISEELFFRGIVFNILKNKSIKYAIIVSSVFFSLLHLANLAGGVSAKYAILQVIFAFIFGIVAAQISVLSKSLLPAIIWHFTHDFIAFITGNNLNLMAIIILCFQCVVMSAYAIYLNKKITHFCNS